MKILFAAGEAAPFIKSGGLGDVMGALPKALVQKGMDIRVVLPLYASMGAEWRDKLEYLGKLTVPISWRNNYCGIFTAKHDGVTFYFIDNEQYFKRSDIYGEYDDGERFAFFSKAVLEILPVIEFFPDIINANDWHTALIPVYLNIFYKELAKYQSIKTVLSIHNIEFQGKYDPFILGSIFGLDVIHRSLLMYDGCLNILKGGIECADMISTVSKSYAHEILRPEHSHGMHNILNVKQHKLKGIINGIDTVLFDPETDKYLSPKYNWSTIRNKPMNKKRLQRTLALPEAKDVPLIGMVTRLTHQKGIGLIKEVMHKIMEMDIQFVLLGTGYEEFEAFMHGWEYQCRDKMRGIIKFSLETASQIYAGADLFLMPSISEPCGLSQMIAMRYGTIPIVNAVGGLRDTVEAYDYEQKTGTGITFQSPDAYDMLDAINRSVELYRDKTAWRQVRKNAMAQDFSWDKSADEYIEMYNNLKK